MPFQATFIVLSVMGILDAGYLNYRHAQRHKMPLVCPLNHNCGVVTESKWSHLFGVRNEVLGLLFYLVMLGVILGVVFLPEKAIFLQSFLKLTSGVGVLYSAFLVSLEIFVIKDYCFYCLVSVLITVLIFINSFFIF